MSGPTDNVLPMPEGLDLSHSSAMAVGTTEDGCVRLTDLDTGDWIQFHSSFIEALVGAAIDGGVIDAAKADSLAEMITELFGGDSRG